METSVLVYTVVFLSYSLLEVTGGLPQEVISEGLSLPSLFKGCYGDEEVDFVSYHIKRTTAAVLIHCLLPLIYIIGLQIVYPHFNMILFWQAEATIFRLMILSLSVGGCGIARAVYLYLSSWSRHPFAGVLSKYGRDWRNVRSLINAEFRSMDKFVSVTGSRKLIAADNWIIHCCIHSLTAVKQSEITLCVENAEQHRVESEAGVAQYLVVKVSSTGTHTTSFKVRLRSDEYAQLRLKVTSPVEVARQVVIQQSLNERFFVAFQDQVAINGVYRSSSITEPLEPCFGCSQVLPEVKLKKMCASLQEGECRSCDCKPMWCMSCMSKWFANRQDQGRPDTWMGSHATCPLCRKTFCMLDIMSIEQ